VAAEAVIPELRAAAAMDFIRGVSVKRSYANASAEGAKPKFAGTLAEWSKLRGELTDEELGAAHAAYLRSWNDVPLATKKRRVEELASLFDRLVARLARLERAERVDRKAAREANVAARAAGKPAMVTAPRHSAEWVRTASEMRATLRDIALEMGEDRLIDKFADAQASAATSTETLREFRALLDMEMDRREAAAAEAEAPA